MYASALHLLEKPIMKLLERMCRLFTEENYYMLNVKQPTDPDVFYNTHGSSDWNSQ